MISSLAELEKIISKFPSAKIAVFGDLMLDIHISGKAERISQEAPVPVVLVKSHKSSLGGAANVIKNISIYGTETYAFGVIGNDKYGAEILELLHKLNCNTSGIKIKENHITTRKERVIAGSQQLLRIDYEDTTPIKSIEIKDSLSKLINLIEGRKIDAVIVEDYAKGLINKNILRKVVECCNKNRIICALDPHPSHPFNIKGITFMTPNRNEAMALSGINSWEDTGKNKKLYEAAEKLIRNWGLKELIITLGPDGMALFKGKNLQPKIIPTKAKEVFDVSGAGDTVIALYTLSLISGASSEEAAEIANHAAGIVVGKIGTATASKEEIITSFKEEEKK